MVRGQIRRTPNIFGDVERGGGGRRQEKATTRTRNKSRIFFIFSSFLPIVEANFRRR